MTSTPSLSPISAAPAVDIAAHQKAAEALLRTCGKYGELSVFDVLFELKDGRYVSAKDGLTDITEDGEAEELPSYVAPEYLEKCPASQDVIDGPPVDFKVVPALPTFNTLGEMGWPVEVASEEGGPSFYTLALQVLNSKECMAKWPALDAEKVRAAFEEEAFKAQPKDAPDSYSAAFIALVGSLALHKTDGWAPSRSLLAAFASIIATFPDFLAYVHVVQGELARVSAEMLAEAAN